jgi:hypothetical protein
MTQHPHRSDRQVRAGTEPARAQWRRPPPRPPVRDSADNRNPEFQPKIPKPPHDLDYGRAAVDERVGKEHGDALGREAVTDGIGRVLGPACEELGGRFLGVVGDVHAGQVRSLELYRNEFGVCDIDSWEVGRFNLGFAVADMRAWRA